MASDVTTATTVLGLLLALAGCGVTDKVTSACTTGTGASRTCVEVTVTKAVAGDRMTMCTDQGGVPSDSCDRAGADGSCQSTQTIAGVDALVTAWFYSGNTSQEMAGCAANGGTWVSP
jgi:hypothetical protein